MAMRKSSSGENFSSTNGKSDLPFEKTTAVMLHYSSSSSSSSEAANRKKVEKEEVPDGRKKNSTAEPDPTERDCCGFEEAVTEAGYGKYNYLLLLASIPGFFGCINTTSTMSLILPSAECDLNLTNFDMGLMNSVSYIGMISCAFFWGFLSDSFGRRNLLIIAFVLDLILCMIVSLAQNFTVMLTAKLFSGFVSAGPYAILMTYLAEYHSSKYRASVLVWTGIFSSLGTVCLPALALLIIPLPIHLRIWEGFVLPSWRVFLLASTVPNLLASILLIFFDESPKFLMSCGRNEEALKVFKTMYAVNTGKPRDTFPVRSLVKEVGEDSDKADAKSSGKFAFGERFSSIKLLFRKPYVVNAVLSFLIQFGTLAGLNTMRLWTPRLFSLMMDKEKAVAGDFEPTTICQLLNSNFSTIVANETQITEIIQCVEHPVDPKIFLNSVIIGVVNGLGCLGSGYLVRITGNKLLIISMYILGGLCSIGMYWSANSNTMLALTSVFIMATSISATTIISVVVNLFPTSLRTMAVSLTMMCGRSGAIIGNLTFPVLIDWDCTVTFFFIAGIVFGTGILSFVLPKTKGAALK